MKTSNVRNGDNGSNGNRTRDNGRANAKEKS